MHPAAPPDSQIAVAMKMSQFSAVWEVAAPSCVKSARKKKNSANGAHAHTQTTNCQAGARKNKHINKEMGSVGLLLAVFIFRRLKVGTHLAHLPETSQKLLRGPY